MPIHRPPLKFTESAGIPRLFVETDVPVEEAPPSPAQYIKALGELDLGSRPDKEAAMFLRRCVKRVVLYRRGPLNRGDGCLFEGLLAGAMLGVAMGIAAGGRGPVGTLIWEALEKDVADAEEEIAMFNSPAGRQRWGNAVKKAQRKLRRLREKKEQAEIDAVVEIAQRIHWREAEAPVAMRRRAERREAMSIMEQRRKEEEERREVLEEMMTPDEQAKEERLRALRSKRETNRLEREEKLRSR